MKKYIAIILAALMFATIPITAYATESTAPSNDKANVTFFITDETGGYPGSSFTAYMTDKTGTITDSYTFTEGNSWGGNNRPIYTMTAPTNYTVTFEGLESGYAVVDTVSRSKSVTFDAPMGGTPIVLWSIIKEDTETRTESGMLAETNSSAAVPEPSDNALSAEEPDTIYQEFLDTTAFIADNEDWYNNVLKVYELFPHEEWYAAYVEGGTEEEFLAMSLYDRFVWHETYLIFAWAVNTGNFDSYFGSEKNFENSITNDVVNLMNNSQLAPENKAVIDAYLTLANWQYNYVKANGVPFNFINNRSYLEELRETATTKDETEKTDEIKKTDEEELYEAAKELLEDADETTKEQVKRAQDEKEQDKKEKEKGIWDDTFDALARNLLTVIILVIFIGALAVVIIIRKRRNIDDNKDGDTSVSTTDEEK